MDNPKQEFWEDDPSTASQATVRRSKSRLSIKKILILTSVVAAAAVCLGHLVRAATAGRGGIEIGLFVVITAMMPTVFLAVVSLLYSTFGKYLD